MILLISSAAVLKAASAVAFPIRKLWVAFTSGWFISLYFSDQEARDTFNASSNTLYLSFLLKYSLSKRSVLAGRRPFFANSYTWTSSLNAYSTKSHAASLFFDCSIIAIRSPPPKEEYSFPSFLGIRHTPKSKSGCSVKKV